MIILECLVRVSEERCNTRGSLSANWVREIVRLCRDNELVSTARDKRIIVPICLQID